MREFAEHGRIDLLASVERPHPDGPALAESGLADWASALPEGDTDLVDMTKGTEYGESVTNSAGFDRASSSVIPGSTRGNAFR